MLKADKRVKPLPPDGNGTQPLGLSWNVLDVKVTGDMSIPSTSPIYLA